MLKIPKLAAIAVGSILSIVFLVIGFSVVQNLSGRAEDQVPRDVVVSDMTTSSARITYATGTNTQGVVEYGVSPTTLNLLAPEGGSDTDHKIKLKLGRGCTTQDYMKCIKRNPTFAPLTTP